MFKEGVAKAFTHSRCPQQKIDSHSKNDGLKMARNPVHKQLYTLPQSTESMSMKLQGLNHKSELTQLGSASAQKSLFQNKFGQLMENHARNQRSSQITMSASKLSVHEADFKPRGFNRNQNPSNLRSSVQMKSNHQSSIDDVIIENKGGEMKINEDHFDTKFNIELGNQNTFAISDGITHLLIDPQFSSSSLLGPNFIFFDIFQEEKFLIPDDIKSHFQAIILSDDCHIPSLQLIDKTQRVIASSKNAWICKELGFKNFTILNPEREAKVGNIKINALHGAKFRYGYIFSIDDEKLLFKPRGDAEYEMSSYLKKYGKDIKSAIVPLGSKQLLPIPLSNSSKSIIKDLKETIPSIERIYDLPLKEQGILKEFFLKENKFKPDQDPLVEVVNLYD